MPLCNAHPVIWIWPAVHGSVSVRLRRHRPRYLRASSQSSRREERFDPWDTRDAATTTLQWTIRAHRSRQPGNSPRGKRTRDRPAACAAPESLPLRKPRARPSRRWNRSADREHHRHRVRERRPYLYLHDRWTSIDASARRSPTGGNIGPFQLASR